MIETTMVTYKPHPVIQLPVRAVVVNGNLQLVVEMLAHLLDFEGADAVRSVQRQFSNIRAPFTLALERNESNKKLI